MNKFYKIFCAFLAITFSSNIYAQEERLSKYSISDNQSELGIKANLKFGTGKNINSNGVKSIFKADGAKSKYANGNDNENEAIISIYDRFTFANTSYLHNQIDLKFFGFEQKKFKYKEIDALYSEIGNITNDFGSWKFWGGKKSYSAYPLAINDLSLIDVTGKGFGFSNDLNYAKFSYAYLRSKPIIIDDNEIIVGKISQINHDFRIADIKSNENGSISLWYDIAETKKIKELSYPIKDGYALGIFHSQKEDFLENNSSFQYGTNLMYNLRGDYIEEAIADAQIYHKAKIIRATNSTKFKINEDLSLYSLFLYENTKSKQDINSSNKWYSFGLKPTYFINDNIRLSIENGYDLIKSIKINRLNKITFAGEYILDRKESEKPLIKLYLTKALWNKSNNLENVSYKFSKKGRGTIIGIQYTQNLK